MLLNIVFYFLFYQSPKSGFLSTFKNKKRYWQLALLLLAIAAITIESLLLVIC